MVERTHRTLWGIVLIGLVVIVGCHKKDITPDFGPLRTQVERLYLNYHELKVVHSDLHAAARRHIEQEGGQLPQIQSAARFIEQANLIAYYQWELLSITEYIREGSRADFFTLRVRGVADAQQKSKDLIMAIKVYEAFIQDAEAIDLIEKGIGHIQGNIAIFNRMQQEMTPLANPPGAFSIDRPKTMI